MQVVGEICSVRTCTRPGCSVSAGCQGHALREIAPGYIEGKARELVEEARRFGIVLTVEQRSLQPLAMGHYETVVIVRRARGG